MRDKLIDIILAAQGYKDGGDVPEYWQAVYQAEMESRRKQAGKIADALLAAGVVATDNNDGCKWVSVLERLPTEEEYMAKAKDGAEYYVRLLIAYKTDIVVYEIGYYDGYKWMAEKSLQLIDDVVAWKPLLALPKEE